MQHLSLATLTQQIKTLFFGLGEVWVTAEIAEVSIKGHCYLDLVQKDEKTNAVVAKIRANLWQTTLWAIRTTTKGEVDKLLQKGNKVLLAVTPTFHEVYGVALVVHKVDINYTMGELERQRLATLERLVAAGLHEKQKKLPLPVVLQRIAVVSSAEAAGYEDFLTHLEQNPLGYAFDVSLFSSAVQGEKAAPELINRLLEIAEIGDDFDCVVLIRGGGSRLDLEVFNHEELAKTIAIMPLPVLTGIGHQKDQSVADFVSFYSLKTPTAVAEFLLQHNLQFHQEMEGAVQQIKQRIQQKLHTEQLELKTYLAHLQLVSKKNVLLEQQQIQYQRQRLRQAIQQNLWKEQNKIQQLQQTLTSLHPNQILARGYTMTLLNGKLLTAQTAMKVGDEIVSKGQDFEVKSHVVIINL